MNRFLNNYFTDRMKQPFTILIIFFAIITSGCSNNAHSQRNTVADAEEKFLKICREDNNLPVQLFNAQNTVWIYLPMEEDLIDYHGALKNDALKSKRQFNISTFEGEYKDKDYQFVMDIADGIKTSKDPGYKSDATETFIKNRLTIYGAISEAYFDIGELPGNRHFADKTRDDVHQNMVDNYVPNTQKAPEFIGVVIANIKKGIAYKTVLNLNDYKLYRSDVLTSEEYNLREISELYGDVKLVDDWKGTNLEIKPVDWTWFFIEQIKNRVNFKFTRSDFPPEVNQDLIIEIATIIAETFRFYEYADYSNVLIKNLRDNTSYNFDRPQIISFEESPHKAATPRLHIQYLAPVGQNSP